MRWIMALIVFFVTGTSLWLSVPRFFGSLLKAPAHFTVRAASKDVPPPPHELARAATYLEEVLEWEDSSEANYSLGLLLTLQAGQTDQQEWRRRIADRAAKYLEQSLGQSPSRPQPWFRLAFARYFRGDDPADIILPLAESVQIGPFLGKIAVARLELLLLMWKDLPTELKHYTLDQVLYIWPDDRSDLLNLARKTPRPDVIRYALRENPGAFRELDRALTKS